MGGYQDSETGKFITREEAKKRGFPVIISNSIICEGKIIKKICSKCGKIKLIEEFGNLRESLDGKRRICKSCRKFFEKPNMEWRKKQRLIVLVHYGGNPPKCVCCGENHIEFLTIDHIDGGGNKHRKKIGLKCGVSFNRWLIRNGFPSGFRVLCMNCNFSIGHYGYCPHNPI